MKTRILGMAIGLGALWAWSPGCTQPKPECNVGTASAYPYIAKFIPQGADCAEIPGDYVGMQVYNPAAGNEPDMSIKQVALQTATAGTYLQEGIDVDASSVAYSLGTFDAIEPDGSNMCSVTQLSEAHMVLPVVPGEEGGGGAGGGPPPNEQEAVDITYRWSNLKLYVTPANLGNQAEADLTFTDGETDCTSNYHVVMLWPAVACERLELDAEGNVVGTGEPEPKLCDQEPDPEVPYELAAASGISPDLRVICDPVLLHCVLDGDAIQKPDG